MKQTLLFLLLYTINGICQGFFDKDWDAIIDTTWGQGLPTNEKLEIFDSVWNLIDHKYAAFHNLDIDWNEERDHYRPEIENGVSRGRFAAIINHLSLKLKETHTRFQDVLVNINTPVNPGIPLIYSGWWGTDNSFSAGLSPLPDSSLLVYIASPNHPLGLEPGDIILGYEGVPWKTLYKELLKREFPVRYPFWGSNEKAFTHCWLMSAGKNWHLFDTIDIKKYSGDIIHLPTSLLINNQTSITYSEQLPVPGIVMDTAQWNMSWGIVEDTNIGYLYIYNWFANDISLKFYNALDSLINIYNVEGLILDLRANSGGHFENTDAGLQLLFNSAIPDLGLAERDNPFDHYTLIPYKNYHLSQDTNTFFYKPIAVLTGPISISASDFLIKRLKSHPRVKLFGKTSSTAFASSKRVQLGQFIIDYAFLNGFSEENSNVYLTHLEMEVDYEVSFMPGDVRNGDDTVVNTAIAWIEENINHIQENITIVSIFKLYQNYPNPFNPTTNISYTIPELGIVTLKIYDVLGKEVATIVNEEKRIGTYEVEFDATRLTSGIYFYRLQSGQFVQIKKMIFMK